MATRKMVPRADNEGGLGTALKRWASAFINALTADGATIGTLSGIVKAAAGVLSATALGAANLQFFMNAAGNAPEWETGIKIGTFQRDQATASGTQAITGVGFKPSHVIFLAVQQTSFECSIGFDNGTIAYSILNYGAAVAGQWAEGGGSSIYLYEGAGTYYIGNISALESDGFTITWARTGAPTGTGIIYFMAFR